ncbi:metalloprotease [Collibacillus ludicampi]|uniref:Metalloprotease n=1 Tax=Collibacillus ludicampi TaxID=2771369 RepID=A0AAV4LCS9_9BACL|nr:M48 family metallopeptidase [Collibacillus ludicampi]GIM45617.1 metalloprotease [Collibacillus ludicampi]
MQRGQRIFPAVYLTMLIGLGLLSWWVYVDPSTSGTYPSGDPANPLSFMSPDQLAKAVSFSRTKEAIYFASQGYEWLVYLLILAFGLSARFRTWAARMFKRSFGQAALFTVLLMFTLSLLELPVRYFSYRVNREYGLSNQVLGDWLTDLGKSWLVSVIIAVPLVWMGYAIVRKSPKRWWFWYWLAFIPVIVFLMFIQPLVIDPLFNKFQPLQDQALKADILSLAHQANIPADQVYEVDMSTKTNAVNAYVNGIGPSARIVLWDTTLKKLSHDEILFIMGHEMGHYVMHHVVWGMLESIGGLFILLWVLSRLLPHLIARYGNQWGVRSLSDHASLPLVLLVVSIVSFATSPLENYISRVYEHAADVYGIQMTGKPGVAVHAFQKLASESLSEPNPPSVVKFFLYDHPTLSERIAFAESKERK